MDDDLQIRFANVTQMFTHSHTIGHIF